MTPTIYDDMLALQETVNKYSKKLPTHFWFPEKIVYLDTHDFDILEIVKRLMRQRGWYCA